MNCHPPNAGVYATPGHQIRRLCPQGGWWKKWDEVCDQVFGTNNEVSEKNWADTLLETSERTGDYWFSRVLAKYLFTREIEDRAIHLFPFGHEVAVSSNGRQDRHST